MILPSVQGSINYWSDGQNKGTTGLQKDTGDPRMALSEDKVIEIIRGFYTELNRKIPNCGNRSN